MCYVAFFFTSVQLTKKQKHKESIQPKNEHLKQSVFLSFQRNNEA